MQGLPTRRKKTPSFFCTVTRKVEPVGDDCVRIYCSVARNGQWDDQVEITMPITSVLSSSRFVVDAVTEILNETETPLPKTKMLLHN
ncbi:hypothetical protein V1291_000017 [Nitrobacteraceae bacterium AZCC 1564]